MLWIERLSGDTGVVSFERISLLNWIGHVNRGKSKGKGHPRTGHEDPDGK